MLKSLLKAVGLLVFLAWFNLASAATMGSINVMSALGYPLKAEISLGDLGKNDKSTLVVKMASADDFKNAGLDYPYSLPKLAFEVDTRSDGEIYLKLTSVQPVNEPFVSLLVELNWPSGKLLREYTFLLDPAGFVAEKPKAAEVKPVEPMVPPVPAPVIEPIPEAIAAPVPLEVNKDNVAETEPVKAETASAEQQPPAEPVKAEMAPAEQQALVEPGKVMPAEKMKVEPLPLPANVVAKTLIKVIKGDTLSSIAAEEKPVDVSLERMLVALYRANAQKFDGKNMNRIRAGKILRMPDAAEIAKVTQASAVKQIRAQVADWQDYRQKLAAADSVLPEQTPKQEAAGKISAAVAEKAPVIKESAKEVLRLSKGESLGEKTVTGGSAKSKVNNAQELLTANADDAAAKQKQIQEDKKRIEKLENISKETSKLLEMKALPVEPAKQSESVKPPVAENKMPAPKAAPTVRAAVPATPPVGVGEPDFMTMISGYVSAVLDDPIMLGAGVAVLLVLVGLGFVLVRRSKGVQKKRPKERGELGAETGSWRTPTQSSPETGDFTTTTTTSAAAMSVASALDDVDPISEADLFLNFGRDVQAEEILKDALTKTPSNVQIKLKLLSIYVNRKDTKLFSRYAQEVKDSGDTAAWERAAVMGREIDPGNPTYGGVKGEIRHREPAKAEVDFDLGSGNAVSSSGNNADATQDFKMDFDLTGVQSAGTSKPAQTSDRFAKTMISTKLNVSADVDATNILSRETVQAAEKASPMDFDVSGILPGNAKNITQSSIMDFDVSGILPELGKGTAKSNTMDFDVTGGTNIAGKVHRESAKDTAIESSALNFNELVFDIPASEPASKPKIKAATDEGMTFSIDSLASESVESASWKPSATNKVDIDFGNININMGDDAPSAYSGGDGKDDQWHEVATKLDLAKAYQEMGDLDGAREILEEVVRDGDATQRESAEMLMQQIAA